MALDEPDGDDEDTVVRPRTPGALDPSIADDDTVIKERVPFADVPAEALWRVAVPLVEPVDGHGHGTSRSDRPKEQDSPPPVGKANGGRGVHRIRVNQHDPIGLDAPAILGRQPAAPRITTGRVPRLVRVPSPLQEVSGTHVEFRQQGSTVIVTDLRSTNGTVVSIPGIAPRKLRQGESIVVTIGTVVDIGDGNIIEILPVERIVPPPS